MSPAAGDQSGSRTDPGHARYRVILGVSGGIAAYKACEVLRRLTEDGHDVRVIPTESALKFVGAATWAALSGQPVTAEVFDDVHEVPHVALGQRADLVLVVPATADLMARAATGRADDLLTSTLLTARCPVVFAPAMHTEMWEHPATRANVETLRSRGALVIEPAAGRLTGADSGKGRLPEPAAIAAAALDVLHRGTAHPDLAGHHVVVSAGGTREAIDPVRFIGNRSSGLMGVAVADEAARRGAKVTLVAGPQAARPAAGVDVVGVATAEQMRAAVLDAAPDADVIVKAAAVADFKPETAAERKLKKAEGAPGLKLVPTPDILAELGSDPDLRKQRGVLVGFAAETETDPARLGQIAEEKRKSKGADLIVANDVSSPDSGFGARTNRAVIAGPKGVRDVGLVTKNDLAAALMDEVVALV
jgi:phosphopantothenoylcysteine decarboxylase / phosphopantothenate---cysteine ligase